MLETAKRVITNRIFKKIIASILLFYILFSSMISSLAINVTNMDDIKAELTAERAGNYVANFAINFESNFGKKVVYSDSNLDVAYNGNSTSNNEYQMNNYSWIAFVYNQSLKLYSNENIGAQNVNSYVIPHTNGANATWSDEIFEQIKFNGDAYAVDETTPEHKTEYLNISDLASTDEIYPGDVLIKTKKSSDDGEYTGQVFLYIGVGQVLYCNPTEDGKRPLVKCYVDELDCTIDTVLRIKEETANKIYDTDTTLIFAGKSYDPQIKYEGAPGYGTYLGTSTAGDFVRWIVDKFADIMDYIIGIQTYAVRAILIGWTNLVENLLHYTMLGSKEDVNGAYVNSLTGKANNLGIRVSIEDILFNRIPILDVNFFSVEQAGGSEIAEGSIVYSLRQNISFWYYIIRIISIIIMLFVLIYVGFRIALTTIADRKAQYKSALVGWIVGFIAVVAIHLFMYIVFEINEYFIKLFNETAINMNGGEFSLYETIRTKSYAPKFTEGFGSTIMYMFLVYMLIRFSIIYFKRYLTVTILGLIGPVMGVKYGVERATGRKTKSLSKWMFEFSMNVFLQSVHALLYVCLMQIALSMAFTSLAGYIVALVILNFMLKADKIFMNIFNFDRAKSVGDTSQPEGFLQQFAKITVGVAVTGRAVKSIGKGVFGVAKVGANFIEESGDIIYDREKGETKKQFRRGMYKAAGGIGRIANKVTKDRISSIAALSLLKGTKESKKMDEAAIKALKLNTSITKKEFKRSLDLLKGTVGGAVKLTAGIPLTIADPMAGVATLVGAYSGIKKNINESNINHINVKNKYNNMIRHQDDGKVEEAIRSAVNSTPGKILTSPARAAKGYVKTAGGMAGLGMGVAATSAGYDTYKFEEERLKNHKLIEDLKNADVTEKEIDQLYKELEEEERRLNSGLTSEELKQKVNKEFSATVSEAKTKRVKSSTVKGAIDEYMSQNGVSHLSEQDVDNIMSIIKRRESEIGKILVFDNDVMDNIRDSLRETIERNTGKKERTAVLPGEMHGAFKKGLAKQGSIKSQKIDTSRQDRKSEIQEKIQEKVRQYENIYEGSKKKVEKTATIINRIKNQNNETGK